MKPGLAASDQDFAEELVSEIDANWVRSTYSYRYGRGWQRRLANNLGVAESTISGWLKADQIPNWAKLAMGALVLRDTLSNVSPWRPVKTEAGYAVYSYEGQIGALQADGIPTATVAFLIAAAPALRDACAEAEMVMGDAGLEEWEDIIQKLRDVLDAARPEHSDEHPTTGEADE